LVFTSIYGAFGEEFFWGGYTKSRIRFILQINKIAILANYKGSGKEIEKTKENNILHSNLN
jgi:hypothetical protein